MTKRYDLAKTQFLITTNLVTGFSGPIKAFRRKRATMLFDKEGKPMRIMTYEEWRDFVKQWRDQIKEDGLTLRTVWTLEEIKK